MILSKRGTGINNGWKVSILGNDAEPTLPARIFCYHVSGGASQDIMVSDTKFNINQWYNLVITYNNATKTGKMYVNGILETQKENLAIPNASTDAPLFIGKDNPLLGTNYFFHGKIDDIKIFNKALSAQEINDAYSKNVITSNVAFEESELLIQYFENEKGKFLLSSSIALEEIVIYSIMSNKINSIKPAKSTSQVIQINGQEGIYIIKARSAGNNYTRKIIVK